MSKIFRFEDTKDKALSIGPWFGELGYELFDYQAKVRGFVSDHAFSKVVALCRSGRAHLYEDFATEIIEYDYASENCFNAHLKKDLPKDIIEKIHKDFMKIKPHYNIEGGSWVWNGYKLLREALEEQGTHYINRDVNRVYAKDAIYPFESVSPPRFIEFGNENQDLKYDFVIHARNVVKEPKPGYNIDTLRNWEQEKWDELISKFKGFKIACIGSLDYSFVMEGCDDFRGKGLSFAADLLRSSKLIVGPSSGPMHFASLCGCRQAVWDNVDSKSRYLHAWNPFGEKVYYYDNKILENDTLKPSWFKWTTYEHSPSVENIYKFIEAALEEKE